MKNDIYFEPNYGKLYESVDNGENVVFEFESRYGTISHMFIKREIPIKINAETYYDIVTPYGYGGPLVKSCEKGKEKELIEAFDFKFRSYCNINNIVSEFVRFHPIIKNAEDFKSCYEAIHIRDTIGTKLEGCDGAIVDDFSKSAKKTIRRALKSGLTYKITERPDNLNKFKEIYFSTMDRNEASDYYYFGDDYFNNCLKYFKNYIILVEVIYEGKVIASGLYFVYKNIIHAHLSGTLKEYIHLSPAYIIKHATAEWAKQNGVDLIHYGGGTSNSDNDPLYQFKKKFTKNTFFKFHIGKKIWNEEIYAKLCNIVGVDKNTDFFPAYRSKS